MPFAVTHVLFAIIIVDLYRDYFAKHKKYFTLHTLFIAGVAGILPDIDILFRWIFGLFGIEVIHRALTHTLLFAFVFLIPGIIFWYYKNHKMADTFVLLVFLKMAWSFLPS